MAIYTIVNCCLFLAVLRKNTQLFNRIQIIVKTNFNPNPEKVTFLDLILYIFYKFITKKMVINVNIVASI